MQTFNEEVKVVQADFDGMSPAPLSNLSHNSNLSANSCTESALEEVCPIHGDVVVAFNKKTGKLVCNQCIYADDQDGHIPDFENMNFTSYVASELKELFDEKFTLYKTQLNKMNEIAPKTISKMLESTVNKFFGQVESQIRSVEQQVLAQVEQSTNLNDLQSLLTKAKPMFGLDKDQQYDQQKQQLDSWVKGGQFTQVVQRKDQFQCLINSMKVNNACMGQALQESQKKIQRIMVIKKDGQQNIGKRIRDIVDQCLEIDINDQGAYKRQKIEREQSLEQEQQRAHQMQMQQQAEQQRLRDEAAARQKQEEEASKMRAEQQAREDAAAKQRAEEEEKMRQQEIARQAEEKAQFMAQQQQEAQMRQQAEIEAQKAHMAEEQAKIVAQQQQQALEKARIEHEQKIQHQIAEEKMRLEALKASQIEQQKQHDQMMAQMQAPVVAEAPAAPVDPAQEAPPVVSQESAPEQRISEGRVSGDEVKAIEQISGQNEEIKPVEVVQESIVVSETSSVQSIPQPVDPVEPATHLEIEGTNVYKKFYRQKPMKIMGFQPLSDKTFKSNEEYDISSSGTAPLFLQRAISLPNDKIFMIGGASDPNCSQTVKDTFELVKDPVTGVRTSVAKTNMWQQRAAFGIAVYPNFSQIFVAGGSINQNEATKHCERYIVDQNLWKRLPELKEAKFSVSLCFFNNGSTLYCFGGLTKSSQSQFTATSSIERLSKGQNSWQVLGLRLPEAQFDIGSMQINASEILLFGGFNENPTNNVYIYKNENPKEEGEFEKTDALPQNDFFVSNGVYMDLPEAKWECAGQQERIVMGHNSMFNMNMVKKTFTLMNIN